MREIQMVQCSATGCLREAPQGIVSGTIDGWRCEYHSKEEPTHWIDIKYPRPVSPLEALRRKVEALEARVEAQGYELSRLRGKL